MTSERIASISLDADNYWSYKRTHGDPDWVSRPSYLGVLASRMIELFDRHRITPTVNVVGFDAAAADGPEFVTCLSEYGCEIGNHSFEHEPWLHLYSPDQLRDDLNRSHDALLAAGAKEVVGLRAPGFSMSPDLMRALVEMGYEYDSSVLATWIGPLARTYYLRTNKDLTAEERRQRKGLFGSFWDAALPNKGFEWTAPAAPGGQRLSLTEVPVTVFPGLRVPIHASYVIYLSGYSPKVAAAYVKAAVRGCLLSGTEPSLLLHPLDLLDSSDAPGLEFFPGMNLDFGRKRAILDLVLQELTSNFTVVTMREHARHVRETTTITKDVGLLDRGRRVDMVPAR
mgnify:CR=1 FL=1